MDPLMNTYCYSGTWRRKSGWIATYAWRQFREAFLSPSMLLAYAVGWGLFWSILKG